MHRKKCERNQSDREVLRAQSGEGNHNRTYERDSIPVFQQPFPQGVPPVSQPTILLTP
jgi:hypothetical protein